MEFHYCTIHTKDLIPLVGTIFTGTLVFCGYFITQHLNAKVRRKEELRKYISEYVTLFKTRDLNDEKLVEDLIRYSSIIRLHLNSDKSKHRKLIAAINAVNKLIIDNPKAKDSEYKNVENGVFVAALSILNFHYFWSKWFEDRRKKKAGLRHGG